MKKKSFYIIDISSFFFRSYYAVPGHMTSQEGVPTNALYGTLSMIFKLVAEHNPSYIAACLDTKHPSFRKDLFKDYKANRGEMPEDLEKQVPYLKKMLDVLNIASFEKPGFEADDLIGSLVSYGDKQKLTNYIVSGDKDFAQLVSSNTFLLDTMKSKTYSPEDVQARWGILPEQVCDYLALVGDSSDNIPGARGIGPKGALELLSTHASVEKIFSNLNKIKPTLQKKLKDQKDICLLSKKLVTIETKTGLKCKLTDLKYQKPDEVLLKEFLEQLNFETFLKQIYPSKKPAKAPKKRSSKAYIHAEWTENDLALNLEPYAEVWVWEQESDFYLGYKNFIAKVKNSPEIARILDDKWVRWLGYDLKAIWRKFGGINKPIAIWDSMVAGHLLDSKSSNSHLALYKKYLKEDVETDPESIYKTHLRARTLLENKLKKTSLLSLLNEVELPMISVLYQMEKNGLLLDTKELDAQSKKTQNELKKLQEKIFSKSGQEFNISSPKQLGEVLFEKLKLRKGKKIKSGWSTDSGELEKIKNFHEVIPYILEYRELFKLQTTYLQALSRLIHPKTRRIHTVFKQTSTSTGRLSSVNPNLQNIPIRTERGRRIRKAFVAPPKNLLISADYSQIELRILAHISKDKNLIKAFKEDQDIHALTACEVFNVSLKDVTPDLRRRSKAVNFGIVYGQGAYGLADSLNIPRAEAQGIIANYFKKFKSVRDYIESAKEALHNRGFVKTLSGRKRFFEEWELQQPRMRAAAERAAINAPIQGTASDIVKKSMILLDKSLPIKMLSQIHDELLFECHKDNIENEIPYITSIMETSFPLKVPLKVNISFGKNWQEAHT